MRRLTSILLVITLLLGIAPFLSSNSQPNCVNINGIKTLELIAQLETWLNEPDGLNARFLDSSETSQERGERLFYDLVLNNNKICISDLTQEMINSITEVIRSYDDSQDHTYLVDGLTITRSEINLALKAIRDPVILSNPNIFAEATQFARPDFDLSDNGIWLDSGANDCDTGGIDCFTEVNESIRDDLDFVESPENPTFLNIFFNLSSVNDPGIDTNHFVNWTYGKNSGGGKQIDVSMIIFDEFDSIVATCRSLTSFISISFIDIGSGFAQDDTVLTESEASNIDNYTTLCQLFQGAAVGGGAGRTARFSWIQFGIPDLQNFTPQVSSPTLFGLVNSSDTTYAILSFDGRDKVFQDQQVRLNLTVIDSNGRNNITEVHANFNSTTFVLSFYNDSGVFVFNTTTPLIVENLEGQTNDITNGFNITFIFSLSSNLPNGYYDLTNANVTDDNTNSTLVIVRWFSFISQPVSNGGGVSTLSLSPIGPQIMLAFILVGLLSLGQNNPWFVIGGWISMAMAFGMSLTGQIYIGLGSTDNLLTFSQAFPEDFSIWLFRFFIIMQFVYPIRIFVLVYERLITIIGSLRTRFS